jgi:hypothetical protein
MTRKLTILILFFGALFALTTGVAKAAPGDCLILAGQPVCEPYPTPDEPPYYSICTVIPSDDIAPLVRKSCQTYLRETDEAVGDPQIFIYAPDPSPTPTSTAPSTTTTPTSTSAAPSVAPRAPTTSSPARSYPPANTQTSTRVVTAPGSTETVVVAEPVPTAVPCVANAVRGMDGFDPTLDQDNDGVSCEGPTSFSRAPASGGDPQAGAHAAESVSDGMLLALATCAAIVLLLCAVIPPISRRFRSGKHRV